VAFVCGQAGALPFRDQSFDAVVSRVTLPLTNIPESLREIRRVLREEGLLWFTVHSFTVPWKAARRLSPRAWLFFLYVVSNSLLFHVCGRQVSFLGKRYESFQTERGIRRALSRLGFKQVEIRRGKFFAVTAIR
jgi:ubiquinone/menaquinone biosynthesis C-methylase UbiE